MESTEGADSPALRAPGSSASVISYLQRCYRLRFYAWRSAKNNLEATRSSTALGQLWLLLEPAILIAIYWVIFGLVLEIDRGTENYVAFLTIGQVVFRHNRQGITAASSALVGRGAMLRSISFPRAVLPLSQVLQALANHRFALTVMVLLLPIMGINPRWTWLGIIPLTITQVAMNFGVGMLLARATARWSDVKFALQYIFQLVFYASGVFFPLERFVGDRSYGATVLNLATLNPLYSMVELARWCLMGTRPSAPGSMMISVVSWSVVSLIVGFLVFYSSEREYSGVRTVQLASPSLPATPAAGPNVAVQVNDLHLHYEVLVDRNAPISDENAKRLRRRSTQHVQALRGVSFQLERGDALGLIGHNGAGKSTLLQTITGLLHPSSGSVRVSAQPQLLGVQAALNPQISGRRNIEIGCLILGLTRAEAQANTAAIIEFTDLQEFIDLPVRTYSAGMRQRLSFAISTVSRPDILLIDEALAVGDKDFRDRSIDRLRELRDNAGVVIFASHAMGEVEKACTKVLWLHEGQVRMFGETAAVVAAYRGATEDVRRQVHPGTSQSSGASHDVPPSAT